MVETECPWRGDGSRERRMRKALIFLGLKEDFRARQSDTVRAQTQIWTNIYSYLSTWDGTWPVPVVPYQYWYQVSISLVVS